MARVKQLRFDFDDPSAPERSALNELYLQSAQYRTSAAYYSLMKFIARFPRYSPYNCMLLHIQNPEATYVATPNQWMKRFKRSIMPAARPLLIIAPNCPVLFVYDLADTEGDELPETWQNPFEARGKLDRALWERTLVNCRQDGNPCGLHRANRSLTSRHRLPPAVIQPPVERIS